MWSNLHFLRPMWLLVIPAGVLLTVLYLWRSRNATGAWVRVVDSALQPYVLGAASAAKRSGWPWAVALLGICVVACALAGPAWERQSVSLSRSADAMVIALDLSRSMDATDVAPSRLQRARLKLLDILRARSGGDTALVVFSANAFVVTPLTSDIATIEALVPSLDTSLMPSRGSYPDSALLKAAQLFEQSEITAGRILLITDGGNLAPAMTAIADIRAAGHRVSVLAVGTADGGPIPQTRGGFLTDASGNIALPKLEARALRRLARAGGGEFAVLRSDDGDIAALKLGVDVAGQNFTDDEQRSVERWLDRGPWLVLVLLPLVALMFRRGGYAWVLVLAVGVTPRAEAGFWQDLWRTPDQQGASAMEADDAQAAAELFEDPAWQATAQFRAGDYAQSARQFESIEGIDARYNAGTSLARAGQIAQAIEALEAAVAIDPDHEDAQFNLELLRQMQDRNGNAQGEGDQDGEGDQSQDSGEQDGNSGDGQSSADNANQEEGTGEPSDQQSSARSDSSADEEQRQIESLQQAMRDAEAAADETQEADREQRVPMTAAEREAAESEQALEQWLRRVEDDPGGLLRRKFRYQYQRRQTDQDGVRLWPDDRSEPW